MCGADLPLETFLYISLANSLSAPREEENSSQYSAMAWPETREPPPTKSEAGPECWHLPGRASSFHTTQVSAPTSVFYCRFEKSPTE